MNSGWIITRRDFLKASAAVGVTSVPFATSACAKGPERGLSFGLVADVWNFQIGILMAGVLISVSFLPLLSLKEN